MKSKRYLWKATFFVDQRNDIHRFLSQHIQCGLVIHELNMLPRNAFFVVLFLFQFENVLYEELLKVFVAIIDTELFKTRIK